MDERARRIGENEAVARRVNDKLDDLNDTFSTLTNAQTFSIVCECGDLGCTDPIEMTPANYASLRSDATHFATVPGHVAAGTEEVVERHDGYDIVRKHRGAPAALAEATEP